jgi:hypothetical protein
VNEVGQQAEGSDDHEIDAHDYVKQSGDGEYEQASDQGNQRLQYDQADGHGLGSVEEWGWRACERQAAI